MMTLAICCTLLRLPGKTSPSLCLKADEYRDMDILCFYGVLGVYCTDDKLFSDKSTSLKGLLGDQILQKIYYQLSKDLIHSYIDVNDYVMIRTVNAKTKNKGN